MRKLSRLVREMLGVAVFFLGLWRRKKDPWAEFVEEMERESSDERGMVFQ